MEVYSRKENKVYHSIKKQKENRREKMRKDNCETKETARRNITYLIILLVSIIAIVSIVLIRYYGNKATISKGHITRTCKQLLRFLDEEPDFTSNKYKSHIPKQIQKDIETMLNAKEDLDIIYTIEGEEVIRIEKSDSTQSGIIVNIKRGYGYEDYVKDEFSFYKNKEEIIVYGSPYDGNRSLERYGIDIESGSINFNHYCMDLIGTELEVQDIREYQPNMTLVISENNLMLYRLGEQVGETVEFPGGTIQETNYYYIMGEDQTIYYLYFCSNLETPWIRLAKVDNDVVIEEDSYINANEFVKYPIYYKNGKRYAGIANIELEKGYGQNYGRHDEVSDVDILDFEVEVIELTEEQMSKVVVQRKYKDRYSSEGQYEWYLHYCYEAKGQTVYEEKRINGLDSYLTRIIPEERLSSFDGMEVSPKEVDEVINELKRIYEEYEN